MGIRTAVARRERIHCHTADANKDHGVNRSNKQSCSDGPSGFLMASNYLVARHYTTRMVEQATWTTTRVA